MSRALFISEKYIKENTPIDENVDMKKILPTIWMCQIQYIQNLLGTQLYNELVTEIEADTISANNLILLNDYLADCLTYWCMYELQIPLLFNFRNKSTATNNSNFSQPISTKELSRIENRFKDKAEFFSVRVSNYLCANTDIYPLYMTSVSSDDVIAKDGKATTSVYLGSTEVRKCNKWLYG